MMTASPQQKQSMSFDTDNMEDLNREYYEDDETYVDEDLEDGDFSDEKPAETNKTGTVLLAVSLVVLLIASALVIFSIVSNANKTQDIKEWVAAYLYESVSEDGAGLLTDEEITRITEDVSHYMVEVLGVDGTSTFNIEELTEEQLTELVTRIKTEIMDSTNSLTTSDVQTIAEGVVERVLTERGIKAGMSDAEVANLKAQITALQNKDKALENALANAQGKVGPQGPQGERGATGATGAAGRDGKDGRNGVDGKDGKDGKDGLSGKDGSDGLSSYIVFSEFENGLDSRGRVSITTSPSVNTKYMGVATVQSDKAPTAASEYTWSQYVTEGLDGLDGADGYSSYIVFSQYENGLDASGRVSISTSPSANTKFMGVATVQSDKAPTEASAYTWGRYINDATDGKDGKDGSDGLSSFIVFSEYATGVDAQGNPSFSMSPTTKTKYMGVASVKASTAPTDASAYTWSKYQESPFIYENESGIPSLHFQ